MESEFDDELLQLKNALRQETFRFILVGHNRFSIYQDISNWLRATFPERHLLELRLANKDYRQINDELMALKRGIVLIPDFGWLFRKENEAICVAFNQRRDAFARLDIALICFIEPSQFIEVPKKVPDWWSLRSLELDFHREAVEISGEFLNAGSESFSSLGGQTKDEKEVEIQRLRRQIEATEPINKTILSSLYSQIANLLFELSQFKEALNYSEHSLAIDRQVDNKVGECISLNNIGLIYRFQGEYDKALDYLNQSLAITLEADNQAAEATTLNNIGMIYRIKGESSRALEYYEQSLVIRRQVGDKAGESTTLNNIGQIYQDRGEYNKALEYFEQSLHIARQIGNKLSIAISMSNLGVLYFSGLRNVEKAVPLLHQAHIILQYIGSPDAQSTEGYLNAILEEIGEDRFNQIVQATQNDPQF